MAVAGVLAMATFTGVGAADVPTAGALSTVKTIPAEGPTAPGTPCSVGARACVDLAAHTAWLIGDGQVVRGPVALVDGAVEEPTPRGTFTVEWKAEHWTSREFGTPMPYSVFSLPAASPSTRAGRTRHRPAASSSCSRRP